MQMLIWFAWIYTLWYSFYSGEHKLVFFQNEDIFVQLDEVDEMVKIIHAWMGFKVRDC